MVWWVPLAMAAGGYVLDKQMGGNGTKGAIGGLTMGYGMGAGGAAGASGGAAGGKGMAGNTAATGLNAGTALGSGGMASAQGAGYLGMGGSAVNAGLGTGLNTGLQNVTNRITGSGFQPYDMTETLGNSITGVDAMPFQDLGLNVDNAILDPITGMPIGPDMSQNFPLNYENLPPLQDSLPTSNLTAPNWTPDRNVVSGTDGYEQSGMFGDGLLGRGLGYLGDFVPEKKDLGGLALSMGLNALTPEQQERIRHQQAMVSRGQTGSLLGQGGYQGIGGQYISRAQ
jgi:hypothetical protein